MNTTARRHHGFTLIELLVVLAIIGVLTGLILPVLASARGSADVAGCASNLRQLAQANLLFANDHDQRYVAGAASFMKNLNRWHGTRKTTAEPFNHRLGPLAGYLGKQGAIQQCPAFTADGTGFEAGCGGYGYNHEYVGRDDPSDFDNPAALGARVDAFRDAAGTLMFADAAIAQPDGQYAAAVEYSFIEPPYWTWGGPSTPSIHFRHAGRANAIYLDAHVDAHEMTFTRASIYGPTQQQSRDLGIGYFGPEDNSLFDRQ